MSKFFKFSIVSLILVLLPNIMQHSGLQACWNGFEYDKTNFQFWLFQPDLISSKALQLLNYPSFNDEYEGYDGRIRGKRANADTSYYAQNVAEWQAALEGDPSVKTAKKVLSKDIHTVLYNLDPEDYFRKMEKDSLRHNTFIRAVVQSSSLANYLNYAKTCEQLMNFMNPWEAYSDGKDKIALQKYSAIGHSVVHQKTTSPFVRERTAYLMLKMAHYLEDTAQVLTIYKQFFEKTSSKSWVVASASFYNAVAHSNIFERNCLLAQTFENSIDKRWLSLRFFDETDTILRGSLALTHNAHERARMMTLPVLTNNSRQLTELKEIYAIEPTNNLFSLAVQREINKVEDWVYTNRFTEFATSSVKSDYDLDAKRRELGISQEEIDAQNLHSDLKYLNDVAAFVYRVVAERKQSDMAYWTLAAGHLAFLTKDFSTAKKYLAAAKTEKNAPLSIQTQIWLTELLCDLYSAEHVDATAEAAILKFDNFLRKQKNDIRDYKAFRSQVMRFLSDRFIADGKTVKGILILSKSVLTFGSIHNHWEKNFYHKLLEMGTPQDFEAVIDIINRKKRTDLTSFEKWLASEPKDYDAPMGCRGCFNDSYNKPPPPASWDVSKLKDYESILYVNQDKLDSAYLVVKTVPDTFWRAEPYSEYMADDPFTPNLDYRARSSVVYDANWENPTYPKAKYTKPEFLKRLIELKKQLASDPIKYEKNYFLIGTAYFNMTEAGKFWLMSQIYWGYRDLDKGKEYIDNFYGCQRATTWFGKGVKNCKDEKIAALCCFMANQCQHYRDVSEYEIKAEKNASNNARLKLKTRETPLWSDLHQRFRGAKQYENVNYWCQNLESLISKYQ